jgi:hypothetical protein
MHGDTWKGEQPPGHFSRKGVFILHGVLFGALLLAVLVLGSFNPSAWSTLLGGWGALASLSGIVAAFYRPRHASPLSVAWEVVVPRLIESQADDSKLAFIAGLARVSEGTANRGRQRHVEAAVRAYERWYENRSITYAPLAHLLRLLLIDQLRNQPAGGHAVQTISNYLQKWTLRHWPADALDVMTAKGELLLRLPVEQQRLLRWQWLRRCHEAGLTPRDVLSLTSAGEFFRKLLASPEPLQLDTIALAFAVLRLPSGTLDRLDAGSVFHWADLGTPNNFRGPADIIATSRSGDLVIRANGLYFRQLHLKNPPHIEVKAREQFVQTGWTHQRNDGGPDQRYSNNPPVGYYQVVGYDLEVSGSNFASYADPSLLARQIQSWAEMYFRIIAPESKRLESAAGSSRRSDFDAIVRCPGCGKTQKYLEGKVAIAC